MTKLLYKQKPSLAILMGLLLAFILNDTALGNPEGGVVAHGDASIVQQGSVTQINQTTDKAIINWQSFNIKENETTQFNQPNANSITLNRINPAQGASQIFGSLSANGKLILVNPAGIHFGPNASVNVGSIIASTANISDANFLAGIYIFDQASGVGAITNEGRIIAQDNGLVALVGKNVVNNGLIQARLGSIILASGNKFVFDFYGDQLINFVIDEGSEQPESGVKNTGSILADGGKVTISAKSAQGVVDNAISLGGIVQANSVSEKNGVIVLEQVDQGFVYLSAVMNATGMLPGTKGGTVKVLGKNIRVASSSKINVSGDKGGGTILIGGNVQGKGSERNAKSTHVAKNASLNADSLSQGDGGKIVVWSDGDTQFSGSASAKGVNGNGGFIETSGHYLDVTDAQINLSAKNGNAGTWLLDPTDLTISNAATSNVTSASNTYTGNSAQTSSNLNIATLVSALGSANVQVLTAAGGAGTGNGDITVVDAISWSSGNTLTLNAYRHINVNANITNTAAGGVVLHADNTGTGVGTINFGGGIVSTNTGAVSVFYNPTVFGTQDADIATGVNTPSANFTVGGTFSPYMLINNLTNLADIWSSPGNLTQYYALGKDIDATGSETLNPWNTYDTREYSGVFNGDNHTISNFISNEGSLFNRNTGTITNLNLNDAVLNITNSNVITVSGFVHGRGVLVGTNLGTISNIDLNNFTLNYTYDDSVFHIATIGAISGYNRGTISDVYAQGVMNIDINMQASTSITPGFGFIAGKLRDGSIDNAIATGEINHVHSGPRFARSRVGFIVGELESSGTTNTVTNSIALGNIVSDDYDGGLVAGIAFGYIGSASSIDKVAAIGNITLNQIGPDQQNIVGVFAGHAGNSTVVINNAYAQGSIIKSNVSNYFSYYGTFIAEDTSNVTISNSLATGGIANFSSGTISTFGFAANVINSFYDTGALNFVNFPLLGTPGCYLGSCSDVANLSLASTYTAVGWDFTNTWGIAASGLPYLKQFYTSPRVISGTATTPYSTIQLAINGVDIADNITSSKLVTQGTAISRADGSFYFLEGLNVVPNNSFVLTYLTNGSIGGAFSLAPAANAPLRGLNLTDNAISVGDVTLVNWTLGTQFVTYQPYLSSFYTIDATNLTLAAGIGLATTPATTLYVNRNIQGPGGGTIGRVNLLGDLFLSNASTTLDAGSYDIVINNIDSPVSGSLTLRTTGDVTLTGSIGAGGDWLDNFTVEANEINIAGSAGNSFYIDGTQLYTANAVNITSLDDVYIEGNKVMFPTINVLTPGLDVTFYNFGLGFYFNGPINASTANLRLNGDLNSRYGSGVSTAVAPTSMAYAVDANNFQVSGGEWYQADTTLPSFVVHNDFKLDEGIYHNGYRGKFTRLNTTGGLNGIEDAYGLQGLATLNLGATYTLVNNIDATDSRLWNNGYGFRAIALSGDFSGTLDGNNFKIDGLTQKSDLLAGVPYGMFISNTGTIQNIGLTNLFITSFPAPAGFGGLVQTNSGLISNAFTTGKIKISYDAPNLQVGGLVGTNSNTGTITGSYSTVEVTAALKPGTTTSGSIGGLVGLNNGVIDKSYSAGKMVFGAFVDGQTFIVGGLVGSNNATVSNSYSLTHIGGIVEAAGGGQYYVGGVVGLNTGTISNVYNAGYINLQGPGYIGAITSNNVGVSNSFWDTATSGVASGCNGDVDCGGNAIGGTFDGSNGINLSHMMTFANAGWDITNTPSATATAPNNVWFVFEDYTRPMLLAELNTSINNGHQLQLIGAALGANYTLQNDIDLSANMSNTAEVWGTSRNTSTGVGFLPIGLDNPFTGNFDGNSYTINNLYINATFLSNVGLFSEVTNTVQNVGLVNANIIGLNNVGSLVGINSGNITNVYATGRVRGYGDSIGGLVGENDGTIETSYANVNVTAMIGVSQGIGGLVGLNNNTIANVYAMGTVALNVAGNTNMGAGGIIGINNGSIATSYSSGALTINDSNGDYLGGAIGNNDNGSMQDTYYDYELSEDCYSCDGWGFSSYESLTQDAYNFDFSNVWFTPNYGYTSGTFTRPMLRMEYSTTIRNAHQLQLMAMDLSANYQLANDIDASGTFKANDVWATNLDNGWYGYVPVGQDEFAPFVGNFDGNNHTISGLMLDLTFAGYDGLFGYVDSPSSVIKDVGVININFNESWYVGAIAGVLANGASLENVYASGNIHFPDTAGGLVGLLMQGSSITKSHSSVNITDGSTAAGGIVGQNEGALSYVYNVGDINAYDAGGIAGTQYGGTISKAYNTGAISAYFRAGGIVGANNDSGVIDETYNSGAVAGSTAGGLVGENGIGLFGQQGVVPNTVKNSFWDTDTSLQASAVGYNGALILNLTGGCFTGSCTNGGTVNLSSQSTYSSAGWGIDILANDWAIIDGFTRPMLQSEYSTIITNAHQLQIIAGVFAGPFSSFRLANNIDASDTSNPSSIWGSAGFASINVAMFDGQNHTIDQLYSNRPIVNSGGGVFYPVAGIVENVGLTALNIDSPMQNGRLGGITGALRDSGLLSNVFVSGSIGSSTSGYFTNYIGGLVGESEGMILNSFSTAHVFARQDSSDASYIIGGLTGVNNGLIGLSYSAGVVEGTGTGTFSGSFYLGGLNAGLLSSSWGHTGEYYNAFWDIDNSGQSTSEGGIGKTFVEMKQAATYTGFDFATTWRINESFTYPRFNSPNSSDRVIAGFAPAGTALGSQVALVLDGEFAANTSVLSDGSYYFIQNISDNQLMMVYMSGANTVSNLIMYAPDNDADALGVNLLANTLTVGNNQNSTFTFDVFGNAIRDISLTDDILYTTDFSDFYLGNVTNPNVDLFVNDNYTLSHNIYNNNGGLINVIFQRPVTVQGNIHIDLESTGNLVFNSTLNDVSDFSSSFYVDSADSVTFNGVVGGSVLLSQLFISPDVGEVQINSDLIIGNVLEINAPISLASGTINLTSSQASVQIYSTIDGPADLVITGYGNTLRGNIGVTTPLNSLTFTATGPADRLFMNDPTGTMSINTVGDQTYNNLLFLGSDGPVPIAFNFAADNITAPLMWNYDYVSWLFSVEMNVSGSSSLIDNFTFPSLIKSGGGTLALGTNNANNPNTFTVNGGTLQLNNSNSLGYYYTNPIVTVNSGGTLALNNVDVTANSNIILNDGATLRGMGQAKFNGAGTLLLNGDVNMLAQAASDVFDVTFNVDTEMTAGQLILNGGGLIKLANVGTNLALGSVVSDVAQLELLTAQVITDGDQTYNGGVTVTGDSTLTSNLLGEINLLGDIASAGSNLTINPASLLRINAANDISWNITGADTGNVAIASMNGGAINFTGVTNLTGSSTSANTFILNGGTLSGAITGAGSNNTLQADNVINSWNITSANAGSLTGISGGFSQIQNLIGGAVADTFTFNAGTLSGSIVGGSGINTLQGNNASNTWVISAANAGSLTGISGGFSQIENLIGGTDADTFILTTGSLSGSITGNGGNNSLQGANIANTWNLVGSNAGTLGGVGSFSQIQNLIGGNSVNNFVFADGATISGAITGGASLNDTLDYSGYTGSIKLLITADGEGSVTTQSNSLINNFFSIDTAVGNNNSSITLPSNKNNTIVFTGPRAGYINDPINFSNFNSFIGGSGGTNTVIFNPGSLAVLNTSSGLGAMNSLGVTFNNMQFYTGSYTSTAPAPAPAPAPSSSPVVTVTTVQQAFLLLSSTATTATLGAVTLAQGNNNNTSTSSAQGTTTTSNAGSTESSGSASLENSMAESSSDNSTDSSGESDPNDDQDISNPNLVATSPIVIVVNNTIQDIKLGQQLLDIELQDMNIDPSC